MAEFTSDIFSLISKVSSEQELDRASFVQKIESEFELAKNDQIAVHGFRTEELFRYVVIGLGRTKVLKKEDAGEVFSNDEEIRIPDYLILLIGEKHEIDDKTLIINKYCGSYTSLFWNI